MEYLGSSPSRRIINYTIMNHVSKQLSYVLRHRPDKVGITLDEQGWTNAELLCQALNITYEELADIITNNNKQRFEFDITGDLVRARQGHSIPVDLDLPPVTPPDVLLHGTKDNVISKILKDGLSRMSRQYVQLSENEATADEVAKRRAGKSVILRIDAKKMHDDGFEFILSANGVWMTKHVPPQYILPTKDAVK